jgi:malate dehydrogenase (oxaloacetate-decarboxylating)(NADP+)
LKELNKVDSIGPIMLGLSKPVHFQLGVRRGNGKYDRNCSYWCQEKQKKKAVKI